MENISGIIKIEYALLDHIASLRINLSTSKVEALTFLPPTGEIEYGFSPFYFTPQTAELQIVPKLSDAGAVYTCTLRSRTPKDRPESTAFISASQAQWFLLRVTDANGIVRLIGTIDFPAQFAARISIPASPSGYNGYDTTFTSQQLTPPAYFP